MGDTVHLNVTFRSTNPLPKQELKGIFANQFGENARLRRCDRHPDIYKVTLWDYTLIRAIDGLQDVIRHCHKNQRTIFIEVEYGQVTLYE